MRFVQRNGLEQGVRQRAAEEAPRYHPHTQRNSAVPSPSLRRNVAGGFLVVLAGEELAHLLAQELPRRRVHQR